MNKEVRFQSFLEAVQKEKQLNKTPLQVYNKLIYNALKQFLPKDKKLRKPGHIKLILNELIDAIKQVYEIEYLDINYKAELNRLYQIFLPASVLKNTQPTIASKNINDQAASQFDQTNDLNNAPQPTTYAAASKNNEYNYNNIAALLSTLPPEQLALLNQLPMDKRHLIEQLLKEWAELKKMEDIVKINNIDENKYTPKVMPGAKKFFDIDDNGEL